MTYDPTQWQIENRGYGMNTGSVCLPNGTTVQVSDLTSELNNAVLFAAYWDEWMALKELVA